MRRWRKSSWAIAIWTAVILLWIVSGIASTADVASTSAAAAAGVTIGVAFILFVWFLVMVPMTIIWFATKPKGNVLVFGPLVQQVTLTEREAKQRVEKDGWTYERLSKPDAN
jgi:hypothetical protein